MTRWGLVGRNLSYFWRSHVAVAVGVAVAISVFAGALVVGQSVRASLRALALERLGRTAFVVASQGFFRADLAADLARDPEVSEVLEPPVPIVALTGVVTHEPTRRRAAGVQIYGVDERFWAFHRRPDLAGPAGAREAWMGGALAQALTAAEGDTLLLRIERPSAIPLDSLHGRKDDVGRTIRLSAARIVAAGDLGEFSLRPQQGEVLTIYVPIDRLWRDLDMAGRVNTLLAGLADGSVGPIEDVQARLEAAVRRHATLADLDLSLRRLPQRGQLVLESAAGLLDNSLVEAAGRAAREASLSATPVLTYLANRISVEEPARSGPQGARSIPYSLVTAMDLAAIAPTATGTATDAPILLNDWAATDLRVGRGDRVVLEYFVWTDDDVLQTGHARFEVVGIVPMAGPAGDRDLAPPYPGITEATDVLDWDPPFPIDLSRVRPQDEAYWDAHRTTPKAFLPLEAGQRLWGSRHGRATSLRLTPAAGDLDAAAIAFRERLQSLVDPLALGVAVVPVRADAVAASRGATDFGEYFLYFSFFLLVSALLLAGLLFRLGVEQRAREVGLLEALGFTIRDVRRLLLTEGLVVAGAGAALGVAGTIGYAAIVMLGLRTWWVDAVGTTRLGLAVTPSALAIGVVAGLAAAVGCIWWTLRGAVRASPRALLRGAWTEATTDSMARTRRSGRWRAAATTGTLALGLGLLGLGAAGVVGETAGFFGAGALLLVGLLLAVASGLRRRPHHPIAGSGLWPVSRLGFRYATYRPGRSVLCMALVAAAAFIIVAVDAFRRTDVPDAEDRHSGTGGYALMAESVLPVIHDPDSPDGRDALNLASDPVFADVGFDRFRLRPGDDASCLNLYRPRDPRIVGVRSAFIEQGRFAFMAALAETEEERANPWRLLERTFAEPDIVPVIADANSLAYVLHLAVGEDFVLPRAGAAPLRLRVVAALRDSVFQSELLMAERHFARLFPALGGYRVFLIDAPAGRAEAVGGGLESRLEDYGLDTIRPAERLATFHRVENTYLSTFQTLGVLGLLLGTVGLAIVLWRNVLERRRDLALLRAVGYAPRHLVTLIVAENALLIVTGLGIGATCALIAIAPALASRGGGVSAGSLAGLVLGVLVTGLSASMLATITALRAPLLPSLRSE